MSGVESVEQLAGLVVDALNRRDPDALHELVHPEYEFHSRLIAVEGGVYKGRDGFARYFSDLDASFNDMRWELDEILGSPVRGLVIVIRTRAVGRQSGAPIDVMNPQVWEFRDGRVIRNTVYGSKDEALAAAGLSS